MLRFVEFVDRKQRENKRQLKVIKKLLESQEMKVKDHLKDEDPFIFVLNPDKNTFFEGVRIYKIGSQIAFRVQKEEDTEPFGKAYSINIEEMFEDFMTDYNPEKSGKKIIEAVGEEIKRFFEKSSEAEKDIRGEEEFNKNPYNPYNKVMVRSSDFGADYSTLNATR